MNNIRISIHELSEMIQIAENDEGMADLLSKAKEYYLLKRPANYKEETVYSRQPQVGSPVSWMFNDSHLF